MTASVKNFFPAIGWRSKARSDRGQRSAVAAAAWSGLALKAKKSLIEFAPDAARFRGGFRFEFRRLRFRFLVPGAGKLHCLGQQTQSTKPYFIGSVVTPGKRPATDGAFDMARAARCRKFNFVRRKRGFPLADIGLSL